TGMDAAHQCAERLRQNVEALTLKAQRVSIKLTVSVGVAERRAGAVNVDALLKQADDCLYAAKQSGRNRTVIDR
ncbi:MAG TPA: diguanylate cyclase, partial [Gallionella sp.]|nr:diguanylate cyclase [Gallionella sp.]